MKVTMINDCAYVGETLLRYLPSDVEKQHIKRTRGWWSKTFGIAYNILKAKADVYHVHYLLQDCYIASELRKHPLVGHAMGSDLRQQLRSRKWGWIVRSNLRSCDQVLVCQPTILEDAKRYSKTAEYFPIPFDPQFFFPKPFPAERRKKQIFIASVHDFAVKGTDKFLYALASIKIPLAVKAIRSGKDLGKVQQLAKELGLKIDFIDRVPHDRMNALYWENDLVLGSFGVGQLDTVAIEAMACGRPLVHSVSAEFFPECPLEKLETVGEAADLISRLLTNEKEREERLQEQLKYVNETHAAPVLAERLMKVYSELTGHGGFKN
jgi:glycosyltransferase involved in cell wall biosynthesis